VGRFFPSAPCRTGVAGKAVFPTPKPQEHKLSAEVDDIRKEKRDMIKANGGKPLTSEQRKQLRQKQEQNSQKLLQQNNAATTIPSGAAK